MNKTFALFKTTTKHQLKGFTLIELLVFMNIISIVFIMVMSLSTALLKSAKSNENKAYATHYGQETSEWLLGQSQIDWTTFATHASATGAGSTYCFDSTLSSASWANNISCTRYDLGGRYMREVKLFTLPTGQIRSTITISWKEGTNTLSIPIVTVFSEVRN